MGDGFLLVNENEYFCNGFGYEFLKELLIVSN